MAQAKQIKFQQSETIFKNGTINSVSVAYPDTIYGDWGYGPEFYFSGTYGGPPYLVVEYFDGYEWFSDFAWYRTQPFAGTLIQS